MVVNEPIYRFVSQMGKHAWLYIAVATWLLGFATWQVLYLIYSTAPFSALPPGVPGPNSFASAVVGDGVLLPTLNALIIAFYMVCEHLDIGLIGIESKRIGGGVQALAAAACALAACIGTYASWFAAGKVDWTIPEPGTLNFAGVYHAIFLAVETYFIVNFALSVGRILIAFTAGGVMAVPAMTNYKRHRAKDFTPLLCLLSGVWLAIDIFLIALLVDGVRNAIPMISFETSALTNFITMCGFLLAILIVVYRSQFRILFKNPLVVLLVLFALCGSVIPLVIAYLR